MFTQARAYQWPLKALCITSSCAHYHYTITYIPYCSPLPTTIPTTCERAWVWDGSSLRVIILGFVSPLLVISCNFVQHAEFSKDVCSTKCVCRWWPEQRHFLLKFNLNHKHETMQPRKNAMRIKVTNILDKKLAFKMLNEDLAKKN